jgi:hypothetical protein
MRIFKNSRFNRFTFKESISNDELKAVVELLEKGHFDANLGSNLYKMRIARPGEGKSGGYRAIVVFRHEEKAFFVYGFAKSDMDDIGQKEKKDLKELSKVLLYLNDDKINQRLKDGYLIEI